MSLRRTSLRWTSAASHSLALVLLTLPMAAQPPHPVARASDAPASDESTPPITVQIAPPPISISSAMLGVSSPLGAQAVAGKAIFAQFITEHHQSFTDGNRISRSTFSSIYRDVQGRIRRESQLSMPGMSAGIAATFITIVDRQLGYSYVLDPQEMVAHRYQLNAAGPSYVARLSARTVGNALLSPNSKQLATSAANSPTPGNSAAQWPPHAFASRHVQAGGPGVDVADSSGVPSMRIDQPFLAAPNPVRTENLGEQMILGFRAHGTRVITTLPAGQIGNDRPIDIVSEQWFSPDLEMVLRSLHRDPWAGEFTTTVTQVVRGDQPAALFEVPAPYKVIDAATESEHHVLDGHGGHPPGPAPW